jgi:predicted DNA-binding protein
MAKQLALIPTTKSTFRLPVDLHRRLKHKAVEEDRPIAEVVADAIERYLSKAGTDASPTSQS